MNVAIIVAAGSGTRFGSKIPKQFLEINGKPILVYTLERFESCQAIDEIVLVLSAAAIDKFSETIEKYNFSKLKNIVAGGTSRAKSVLNGLEKIDSEKTKIVAVHDGARPLVSSEEIAQTIEKASETSAACLVAHVTDTIKEVSEGKIKNTIDRAKLRRALTPQAFHLEILKRAFENADLNAATDECFLVEQLGVEVSIVEGSARNIKITTPEDFIFAESLLRQNV